MSNQIQNPKNKTYEKECKETKHWLQMLATSNPECKERCRKLWKEAHELALIFSKIINNSKIKKTNFEL